MSTILKTLKKLEEEKTAYDRKLDFREMVLEGESPPYPRMFRNDPRKVLLFLAWLVGGILLGAGIMMWYFGDPSPASGPLASVTTLPAPEASGTRNPSDSTSPSRAKSHFGIPLAQIPEPESAALPPASPGGAAKPKPAAPLKSVSPATSARNEPGNRTAPTATEGKSLASASLRESEPDLPPISHEIHIPGLHVKGIIFLHPGSPVNHIFVSTPEESNLKLKIGETVLGAILQSVEPSRAVFAYKGNRIELGIGE